MTRLSFALPLVALAAPAWAELASVETPRGLARVEPVGEYEERLMVGDEVAYENSDLMGMWIEAEAGSLLLVGLQIGGTACYAQFIWLDAADPGFRHTEEFGTCADLVTVTTDSETVTATMASYDPEQPFSDFVWDGKGAVREVRRGQEASGSPPEAGAEAWVGRYAFDLLRTTDWRRPMIDLLGEDGYALAQDSIVSSSEMQADGEWVAGSGFSRNTGGMGAIAISREDGRLLVAVAAGPGVPPELWGDPRGPLPREVAQVMEDAP